MVRKPAANTFRSSRLVDTVDVVSAQAKVVGRVATMAGLRLRAMFLYAFTAIWGLGTLGTLFSGGIGPAVMMAAMTYGLYRVAARCMREAREHIAD